MFLGHFQTGNFFLNYLEIISSIYLSLLLLSLLLSVVTPTTPQPTTMATTTMATTQEPIALSPSTTLNSEHMGGEGRGKGVLTATSQVWGAKMLTDSGVRRTDW